MQLAHLSGGTTMITSKKTLDRKLAIAAAAFLMIGGAAPAVAQQGAGMPMGGMDHSGLNHGVMGQAMDHGCMMGHGMEGMDHGCMKGHGGEGEDHGRMGHGGMGHGGMDHGGMDHGGGMMMGQGMGGMDHGASGRHGGGMMGHMMMKHMCQPSEHVEGKLAYLKAELKLSEAQTPQWNVFADAFRSSAQKLGQFCAKVKEQASKEQEGKEQTGKEARPGVLEQLGKMERNMTAHLEAVRTIKAAVEPLFAVLNDEQKKTADEIMTHVMGLGMGMGKM
jgi:hypothetical protein